MNAPFTQATALAPAAPAKCTGDRLFAWIGRSAML
jgi:hypothetical protein